MPGAFTHITAINIALSPDALAALEDMPSEAKRILTTYLSYAELGSVSPDYPFASIADTDQNHWVDLMHYERVGILIRSLIFRVKILPVDQKEQCFAWLAGFVSHVIMDITVHPVVELRVGSYRKHKLDNQHQICEMHQDSYIWQRLGISHICFSEKLQHNIRSCSDQSNPDLLDNSVRDLWSIALTEVYSEYANDCMPKINFWHKRYLFNAEHIEDDCRLFPLFQHIDAGLTYPLIEEIDYSYINNLETPDGNMHYDIVFDRAVENIKRYLTKLAIAVFENGDDQLFCNWNLDTGYDLDNNELTAWLI